MEINTWRPEVKGEKNPGGVKYRKADLGEDREMQIAPGCWQPGKTGADKHKW